MRLLTENLVNRRLENSVSTVMVNTAECTYCQESKYILHMFAECNRIAAELYKEIELSAFNMLFGYENTYQDRIPLNLYNLYKCHS